MHLLLFLEILTSGPRVFCCLLGFLISFQVTIFSLNAKGESYNIRKSINTTDNDHCALLQHTASIPFPSNAQLNMFSRKCWRKRGKKNAQTIFHSSGTADRDGMGWHGRIPRKQMHSRHAKRGALRIYDQVNLSCILLQNKKREW